MANPVGIDLGTTFCAVATINASGQPEILRNSDGQSITPSVVLFDGGEAVVGQQAKLQRAAFPDDVVEFVKRQMGSDSWRFYPSVGDESYTPEGISAIILKRLAADAGQVLGSTVKDVVITVPAYFDDAQRKATRDAGEIAGLSVLSVINEPTAAAVSFGVEQDYNGTVLVYDLGGGTFDVTLLKARDGDFDILQTDGDRNLGGFDFDNAVIGWIKAEFAAQTGQTVEGAEQEAQLRDRAEQAKHRLSSSEQAPVFVSAGGRNAKLVLTRETFEGITENLLARTEMLVEDVVDGAGLSFSDIDKVLLVGGSTRMPMVVKMLTRLTGRAPDQSIHPDEAVAKGAAIVAALRGGGGGRPTPVTPAGHSLGISDVVSHGLGVVTIDATTGRDVNSLVVPPNSKIPTKRSEVFYTIAPNQTELLVQVTEGEDEDLRYVRILGSSRLKLQGHPEQGSPLRVVFACDIDGILHIEVVDLVDDKALGEFEIDRASNLDHDEIERMRDAVSNLDVQ
ncbi:Hsp70 family protein [Microlunatus flavus]|uniref:Molecular chaperone DnaK n=1 Tax=Microlunatus flavus TaxID=1036181 RepID=A0A1H9D4U7_9ACTN|nr:Hsp70 family protein [Microlunatus flavus]SEQ08464.1 molecular chaperone DnaK [Microlunatus flavus]